LSLFLHHSYFYYLVTCFVIELFDQLRDCMRDARELDEVERLELVTTFIHNLRAVRRFAAILPIGAGGHRQLRTSPQIRIEPPSGVRIEDIHLPHTHLGGFVDPHLRQDVTDFTFAQGFVIDILIMTDGPEDLLTPEAILDAIVFDDALPELLRIVAIVLGASVDGEEGADDAGQHMDIVHVLSCVVNFPRGTLRERIERLIEHVFEEPVPHRSAVVPSPTDRRVGPVRGARTVLVTPKTSAPAGIRGVQVKVAPAPPAFVTDTES
jgi:hypothetical protein